MTMTINELEQLLTEDEGQNIEYKTAKNSFDHHNDLPDYCAALANEGGGKLILGITNDRKISGSKAFEKNYNKLSHDLLNSIKVRVNVYQIIHPNGRVLVFDVMPRSHGQIIRSCGKYRYPMRAGESLVEMDQNTLKNILNEGVGDFSCQIVNDFKISDIDEEAIRNFKMLWATKQNKTEYLSFSVEKTLQAIGVLNDKGLNYAGLILFGHKQKIDDLLSGSEIIFEWRQLQKIRHDFRKDWREPFFKIYNDIWDHINARNIRFPYHEGFIQREVFAFNEESIREAVLNAIAHRDYSIQSSSIFIKASSEKIVIYSPGSFVNGVNPDNILEKSEWRNRRIAEIFQLAGLVERSGQGMNTIFNNSIREGKGLPDFTGSDNYSVILNIPAEVKDPDFILFLEKAANEKQVSFSFDEIIELEKIRINQKIGNITFADKFLKLGIIERIGTGRGTKYILSHKYYSFKEKPGLYTRIVGISRDAKKQLIIKHLTKNNKGYIRDLKDVFSDLKPKDVSNLLQELKAEGKIIHHGSDRTGYWTLNN